MTSYSFWVAPSRMIAETAGVANMISCTAVRPGLSTRLQSNCATTPRSEAASIVRTCDCWSAGNTSMIRSTVLRALLVCRVPNTSSPVSAAVSASEIVSRSRISPTSTMSESSRSAARSPSANEGVWIGTSRWVMIERLLRCTNSIGSSTVMMWRL